MRELGDRELRYIANFVIKKYFEPYMESKQSIFLCGKNPKFKDSKRKLVARAILQDSVLGDKFDIVLPEDLFSGFYQGLKGYDIMNLEEELAQGVEYIIIIPESEGSIAELVQFSGNKKLASKSLCLIFGKMLEKSGLIYKTYVKRLKAKGGKLLEVKEDINTPEMLKRINENLSKIKTNDGKKTLNILNSDTFILPLVYILEKIEHSNLNKILSMVRKVEEENNQLFTLLSLNTLIKQKLLNLTHEGYSLSEKGYSYFMKYKGGKIKKNNDLNFLRAELMNYQYRNTKLKLSSF